MEPTKSKLPFELCHSLIDWDEEILAYNLFREAPSCLFYFLFRLAAPLYTRLFFLILTNKRVIVIPSPRSGFINLQKHFSVKFNDLILDENGNRIIIFNLDDAGKKITLKIDFLGRSSKTQGFLDKYLKQRNEVNNLT